MKQETNNKIKYAVTIALGVIIFWMLITVIYLIASFASEAWKITWIIFPCAALIFIIVALIYFNKKTNKKLSLINWIVCTVLLCVGAYLLISFLTQLWSYTWIVFLVMVIAVLFEVMIFLQKKPKITSED